MYEVYISFATRNLTRKLLTFLKKMFPTFSEKTFPQKKFPGFSEIFFPPGEISGKISPGDFRGTPGKISGNSRNSRKSPEKSGVFCGFPGWKRGLPPLKFGGFFPKKGGSRKKFPGFPEKVSPRKFPEIPGIPWNFPPNFPGGPRGGPSDVSG